MEMTKKEKVIAIVIFLTVLAAAIVIVYSLRLDNSNPFYTSPTAEEKQNLQGICDYAEIQLTSWADERGWYASSISGNLPVTEAAENPSKIFGIYRNREAKENGKYDILFSLCFKAKGEMFVLKSVKSTDFDDAMEEIADMLEPMADAGNMFGKNKISEDEMRVYLEQCLSELSDPLAETHMYENNDSSGKFRFAVYDLKADYDAGTIDYRYSIEFTCAGQWMF